MSEISYDKIRGLHLEISTKCNSICDMCSRNYKGKVRENLLLAELTLEDCKKIMPSEFISQLELISLCGVYGDPLTATHLLEIIDYFYLCNPEIHINIYTNGSLQNEEWWIKLAKTLKHGYVVFGIDGLENTHSIHRKNTDFNKIISNATAFIKAGGKARWDYIVFKHNENQVEEAKTLSEKLGFEIFQIKKTSRFFKNLYEKDDSLDSTFLEYGKHPIFNANGEIENYLELPEKKEYINDSEEDLFNLIKDYGTLNNYFDSVKIDCAAINTNGIFISAYGEVYPCCNIYQQVRYGDLHNVKDNDELNEYNLAKNENLSAFDLQIKDIVEGPFFKKLQKSWHCNSLKEGKPKSCCRTCGINLNMHKSGHEKMDKRYM
ncbi:MAG: radical SAM protein [Bacilli bacterium]